MMKKNLYQEFINNINPAKVINKNRKVPSNLKQLTFQYDKSWFNSEYYQNQFDLVKVLMKIGVEETDIQQILENMEVYGIDDVDALSYYGQQQLKDLGLQNNQIQALMLHFDENDDETELYSIQYDSQDFQNLKNIRQDIGMFQGFQLYQYPVFKKEDVQDADTFRSIIMIGETGTGKSTLINFFINHYLDVRPDDNFRYQLVSENNNQSQAVSRTCDVNIYYIKPFNGKLGLRLIDTPGFLDTKGVQQDQIITKKIEHCFKTQVESLSTICFLIKSSACKLTPSQNYVLSSIMSMFGKDIIKNFVFIFTYFDGTMPQAIQALEFPGDKQNNPSPVYDKIKLIKQPYYLKINNSCLYNKSKDSFYKLYWETAQESLQQLYTIKIIQNEQQSLTMTRDVIDKRRQIQVIVDELRKVITKQLNEIANIKQIQAQVEQLDSELKGAKNVKDIRYQRKKIYLKKDEYTTNCIICNKTCHFPCAYSDNADKIKCSAMENGICTVCQDKCEWNQHQNMQFRYEVEATEVFTDLVDLKNKYNIGQKDKDSKQKLISSLEQNLISLQAQCMAKQKILRDSIDELKKISLQPPCCQYQEQYVDLMIQQETDNKQAGYKDRIAALQEMKQYWKIIRETESKTGSVVFTQQFLENNLVQWKKKYQQGQYMSYGHQKQSLIIGQSAQSNRLYKTFY